MEQLNPPAATGDPSHDRVEPKEQRYTAIELAKLSIAPGAKLEDWTRTSPDTSTDSSSTLEEISVDDGRVTIGNGPERNVFQDNVERIPGSTFADDVHGDTLPLSPAVLTGLLDHWPAFNRSNLPGKSWSLQNLAVRTAGTKVSLDGGPSFARLSMCAGKASLRDYQRYAEDSSDGDSAPLYVFDPNILGPTSTFCDDGSLVRDAFDTPPCFSRDAAAAVCDEKLRPLPPKWLLVGAARSGTPIHDHPTTVAWNALLVGCKLWCCFPPDVDESALLLNLDGDDEEVDFDLSAVEWFSQELDESATIIVQRPGEVVFLPIGWFHVVLNVETSTALSMSLTLRRDLPSVIPLFREAEEEFARWGQPDEASSKEVQDMNLRTDEKDRLTKISLIT